MRQNECAEQSPPTDVKTIKNPDPGHRDIVPDPDVIMEEEWVRVRGTEAAVVTTSILRGFVSVRNTDLDL